LAGLQDAIAAAGAAACVVGTARGASEAATGEPEPHARLATEVRAITLLAALRSAVAAHAEQEAVGRRGDIRWDRVVKRGHRERPSPRRERRYRDTADARIDDLSGVHLAACPGRIRADRERKAWRVVVRRVRRTERDRDLGRGEVDDERD